MTEEKTITRDDVIHAARAWADASAEDTELALDPEASTQDLTEAGGRVEEARSEFERLLDAWREQQGERAAAQVPARTDVTVVGPVQSGTLRPYTRG